MQALSTAQQLVHGLVVAHFKQNVDTLAVLKEMLEVDNIGVMQTPVNLNLAHQLLLGSGLG